MVEWHLELSVVAGVATLALLYGLAVGPWRRRLGGLDGVSAGQVSSFAVGLLAVLVALSSPLHDLSDHYLLTAHMVQHLLLTMVMPPLLLIGTPSWLVRALVHRGMILGPGRFLTRPGVAFALFNVTFILWHAPALYDQALREHGVHVIEHLLMMSTAMLAWWPVAGPLPEWPRPPYPGQALYLFLQSIPTMALGAVITFANEAFYPSYSAAPRVWGITPLEDQQLAGVVMWIPGTLVYLLALTVVFFRWMGTGDSQNASAPRPNVPG